jgi:hypothetical protein
MGVVIAVGAFAFAAFFVLSAYAPELRRGNDGGAHALSKSAVGFAGLVRLLEARGEPVTVARTERAGRGAGLIVLTPTLRTEAGDIQKLVRGQGSPVLVVLPKWSTEAFPGRPGWVRMKNIEPEDAISPWLNSWNGWRSLRVRQEEPGRNTPLTLAPDVPGGWMTPAGRIDRLQTLQPTKHVEPRLSAPDGVVLGRLRSFEDRTVYVLSDPDLLNTQGLAELETARAALTIIEDVRSSTEPIVFDVSLNGFGASRNLLKLAFSPPFLAATLCAAAAAALAGWQAAVRFGPRARTARAVALGAEALTENAAALIRLSGREHRMAARYAELVEARAAKAAAAPPGQDGAAYLDGLGRSRPGLARWSGLRAEARAVRTRDALLGLARRMHEWKREVAGG